MRGQDRGGFVRSFLRSSGPGAQRGTSSADDRFDDLTTDITSGVDVYVRGESDYQTERTWIQSREPIPEDVIYSVRGVSGARWVFGSVLGMAGVIDGEGQLIRNGGAPTLGMSWSPPPLASPS